MLGLGNTASGRTSPVEKLAPVSSTVEKSGEPVGLAAFRALGTARRSEKLLNEHFPVGKFYSTFFHSKYPKF